MGATKTSCCATNSNADALQTLAICFSSFERKIHPSPPLPAFSLPPTPPAQCDLSNAPVRHEFSKRIEIIVQIVRVFSVTDEKPEIIELSTSISLQGIPNVTFQGSSGPFRAKSSPMSGINNFGKKYHHEAPASAQNSFVPSA